MRAWRALDIRGEFGGWRIGLDCGEGWFISVVVLSYLIYVRVYIHVYHQLLISSILMDSVRIRNMLPRNALSLSQSKDTLYTFSPVHQLTPSPIRHSLYLNESRGIRTH